MRIIQVILCVLYSVSSFSQEAAYKQAIAELQKGKSDQAINILTNLVKKYPNYSPAHFQLAMLHINKREFLQAIRDYDMMLKIDPNNEDILKMRSTIKMNVSDKKGAMEDLSRRIQINPKNPMHYFDRAYARGSDDPAATIADYDQVIKMKPDIKEAYAQRGFAKISLLSRQKKSNNLSGKEVEDACKDLRKAKSMGDNSVDNMIRAYCN